MKSLYITLCLLIISAGTLYAQTVRVVNNNPVAPSGPNVYTTVAAAIAASSSGDIIHIIPSPASYGDFTVNKTLHIYGIGLNPDKDTQALSVVGNITYTSTAVDPPVIGGVIDGLTVGSVALSANVSISNLIIRNNRMGPISNPGEPLINGLYIRNNVFSGGGFELRRDRVSNVVVSNNIFSTQRGVFN